ANAIAELVGRRAIVAGRRGNERDRSDVVAARAGLRAATSRSFSAANFHPDRFDLHGGLLVDVGFSGIDDVLDGSGEFARAGDARKGERRGYGGRSEKRRAYRHAARLSPRQ